MGSCLLLGFTVLAKTPAHLAQELGQTCDCRVRQVKFSGKSGRSIGAAYERCAWGMLILN